jgi:hypothetical protein
MYRETAASSPSKTSGVFFSQKKPFNLRARRKRPRGPPPTPDPFWFLGFSGRAAAAGLAGPHARAEKRAAEGMRGGKNRPSRGETWPPAARRPKCRRQKRARCGFQPNEFRLWAGPPVGSWGPELHPQLYIRPDFRRGFHFRLIKPPN